MRARTLAVFLSLIPAWAAAQPAAEGALEKLARRFAPGMELSAPPAAPAAAPAGPGAEEFIQVGADRLEPLVDAPAFVAASLETMRGARLAIDLEMFDLEYEELAAELCARARAGVAVRVVLDPFVGVTPAQMVRKRRRVDQLRAAGARVVFYPTRDLHGAPFKIDHVKLLVADGRVAVAGGTNWSHDVAVRHDFNVRLEGPAVLRLERIFARDWALAAGRPLPPLEAPSYDPAAGLQILITDADHREPLEAILTRIRAARTSIRTEQFLLDQKDVVSALIAAHRRGVDVRVLLDPNSFFFGGVNIETEQTLLKAGVPVRTFHDPTGAETLLHAKMAVFDGRDVIVGSANWSRNALQVNHELALMFRDPAIAADFSATFDADWNGRSRPAEVHGGLSGILLRLTSGLAGLFS